VFWLYFGGAEGNLAKLDLINGQAAIKIGISCIEVSCVTG
jgi:hypothetical protein